MRKPTFLMVAASALLASTPLGVWAQSNTSSGTFGSRSLGQAMGGGGSSFGGSGMGSGMGSSNSFGSGLGSGSTLGSGSALGSGSRSGRVIPFGNMQFPSPKYSTRRTGDFVGADARDSRSGILGALTGASSSADSSYSSTGYSNRSSTGTSYRGNSRNGRYGVGSNAAQVFRGLNMGSDLRAPANPQLSTAVTQHLTKSMRLPAGAPVEVSVRGDTALLRGVVATEHDRALAEQLVRLEPGVAKVANELRVEPTGATVGSPQGPANPSPATPSRP